MSRVWGRHAPTRSLRKCRRIEEVKSRWSTTFSRIENLWPRDGSCPLPLRSKSTFDKCFRIVKTQKISRGGAAHARGSPFTPNEVPAPVLQRRWLKSRYHVRSAHEVVKVQFLKRRIPPMQRSDRFCRVNRRQNESGVLRGGKSFRDDPRRGSVQNEHDHILWMASNQSTRAVGFTRKIPRYVGYIKMVL